MKHISFIIVFNLLVVFPASSQEELDITNKNMEVWVPDTYLNFTSEEPLDWFTFNNLYKHFFNAPDGVTKTTDAYSGTYALRLENTHGQFAHVAGIGDIADDGVNDFELSRGVPTPYSQAPAKISFWYKSRLTNPGDTSFIRVHLYQGDNPEFNIVAITKIEIPHPHIQDEYTYFETNLDLLSDSLIESLYIEVDMSSLPDTSLIIVGDFLQLDELSLEVLNGIEIPLLKEFQINVFPNPATDFVNIEIEDQLIGNSYIVFFDNSGKKLGHSLLNEPLNRLSLSGFPKAMFYQVFTDQQQLAGSGSLIKR